MVRRIRKSEENLLKVLCQDDEHWENYFTGHHAWLEKALKDVFSMDRVVFGSFETHNGEGDTYTNKLVGCIFLKRSQFDNSIEFKNLILPYYDFKDEKLVTLTKNLIENAVRFCEVRNILKIEIELPQEEHGLISIFLGQNFKIVALRERYSQGHLVCILERSIGETYFGDPYDVIKLSYWLLRSYMPCDIHDTTLPDEENIKISFTGKGLTKAFSDPKSIGHGKLIRGGLWIFRDQEAINEDIETIIQDTANQPLTMLVADYVLDEPIKERLTNSGIIFFDKDILLNISGNENSSLNIPISVQNVGGIITVLEKELIEEYAQQKTLTYYLLSGLYNGINVTDEDNEDDGDFEEGDFEEGDYQPEVLGIYCPQWGDEGPGIVGCAVIKACKRPLFKTVVEEKLPEDSALSKEDLAFYQTYSIDERIAALKLSQVVLFPKPLRILNGDWISSPEVKDYLYKEIKMNACNAAYIDSGTAANLLTYMEEKGIYSEVKTEPIVNMNAINKKRFKVGLSFPGEHRTFVKDIADELIKVLGKENVFYDKNFEAELAVPNLDTYLQKIYSEECELVVPFFAAEYTKKKWCNVEWRSIREILFDMVDDGVLMAIRIDNTDIPGFMRFDGYVSVEGRRPAEIAKLILQRVK